MQLSLSNAEGKKICLSNKRVFITQKGSLNNLSSLCLTRDERLAVALRDNIIEIYDLKTLERDLALKGHKKEINCVSLLNNGCLISCSDDKTIKIWEIKKHFYNCVKTLIGHTHYILKAIQLSRKRIVSCSWDKTIRIWKDNSLYECIKTLKGDSSLITSVMELTNKSHILSAFSEQIVFWDNKTYKCDKILKGIRCYSNNCIVQIGDKIIVVECWKDVSVISSRTFQVETRIHLDDQGLGSSFSIIDATNGTALIGGGYGKLVQLDLTEMKVFKINKPNTEKNLNNLILYNNKLICCFDDQQIEIWEIVQK